MLEKDAKDVYGKVDVIGDEWRVPFGLFSSRYPEAIECLEMQRWWKEEDGKIRFVNDVGKPVALIPGNRSLHRNGRIITIVEAAPAARVGPRSYPIPPGLSKNSRAR